jgi:hypothetical protein
MHNSKSPVILYGMKLGIHKREERRLRAHTVVLLEWFKFIYIVKTSLIY